MTQLRIFVFALCLVLLAACGSKKEPSPDAGQAAEAPSADLQATAEEESGTETTPAELLNLCKIANVNDKQCTDELGSGLAAILISQGENEKAAREAGNAISKAIQNAPLEKRNSFKFSMTSSGSEKHYSFLFRNIQGKCTLQLFNKPDSDNYEILGSTELPACQCAE